ncbi:MAG: PEGA domain-containing protein, partial [Myxococcales bacterium]|nr:PEGA domain-containing protein [Myxococcales bacterium]
SDVYALGVVAYEMLAGRHPFPADTPMRQLLAHLEQPPPSFAAAGADGSVPAAVEAVVMRALAKSREARFDTALDFAEALVAAHAGRSLAGLGGTNPVVASATSPGAPRSTQETTDRRRQATSAAARTGQRRALADTMIAVDQVDLADVPAPRRDLRRAAPYAVLAAVVVAAIALFLAKGGSPTEESRAATPNAVARIAETTPAPGAAMTPAPTEATAAKPAAETAAAPARVETPREEPVAAEVAAAPPVAKPVPVDAIGRDHLIAAKAAALEARRSAKIPITSTPPGAIVRVEGTELGTTPLEVPRPPDGQVWQVTLTKADYQVSFAALSDAVDEVHVAMRKRAVAAPSRTGGATAAPSGGAGEKTDEKFDFNVPIAP